MAAAACVALTACGGSNKGVPAFSADDLTTLPKQDWITNGGTVFNQRYSPLDEINTLECLRLKGVWRIHLGSATEAKYSGEAQPLVHDGVAYVSTGASDVFALDVESGKTIWKYKGNLDRRDLDRLLRLDESRCCDRRRHVSTWASWTEACRTGREFGQRALDSRSRRLENGETITSAPALLRRPGLHRRLRRRVRGSRPASPPTTPRPASRSGASTRFPARARPATTPGRRTTTRGSTAARPSGRRRRSIPSWAALLLDGQHLPRLRRQQRAGRQPVHDLDRRPRRQDGRVPLALPAGAPRHLGLDSPSPDRALRRRDRRPDASSARGSEQDGLGLPPRPDNGKPLVGIDEQPVPQEPRSTPLRRNRIRSATHSLRSRSRQRKPARLQAARAAAAKAAGGEDKLSRPKWDYSNEGRIFTPFWGQRGVISTPSTIGGTNWPPSSYNPETGYLYVCSAEAVSIFTSSEAEYDPRQNRGRGRLPRERIQRPRRQRPTRHVHRDGHEDQQDRMAEAVG